MHRRFWTTQAVKVFTAVLFIIGVAHTGLTIRRGSQPRQGWSVQG